MAERLNYLKNRCPLLMEMADEEQEATAVERMSSKKKGKSACMMLEAEAQ